MAKALDNREFWLPSEFLTDDDFRMDYFGAKTGYDFSHGLANSSGFSSDLSSPVESFMVSTETETDEDDLITFLTRKIAYSTLQNSSLSSEYHEQGFKLYGSPQSTLCGYNNPGSSRRNPKCISQIPSPTKVKEPAGWDLLYAAAREVARMRLIEETKKFCSTKQGPVSVPQISQQQHMQATHFQKMMGSGMWGQEKLGSQFHIGSNVGERRNGLSAAAWPTMQQTHQQPPSVPPRPGMGAIFLGENGAKKERTGTGVFLPRRYETIPPETRKKPAERVVNSLNLNLDSFDIPAHTRFGGIPRIKPQYDDNSKPMTNIRMAQQRRDLGPQPVMNQELFLPQEWTY